MSVCIYKALEQLDVQLSSGTVELRDLELDTQVCALPHLSLPHAAQSKISLSFVYASLDQVLNEALQGLPLTLTRAHVRLVRATIPWKSIFSSSCKLELDGRERTSPLNCFHSEAPYGPI